MKNKKWLWYGALGVLLLAGTCCVGGFLLGRIQWFPGGYREGPGQAGKATEAQVVKAEFGFDLPLSASDVRLAIHGGKDYGISGWMLADEQTLEAALITAGYEATGQHGFEAWTGLYPQMTWFELAGSDVQEGYSHPDHDGRVVISTLLADDGRAEVFFQRWSGKRDPVTWLYFE